MTLEVALDDRPAHEVTVTRSGGQATVFVDGVPSRVSASLEGVATVVDIDGRRETIWAVTDRDTVFVHAFGRAWVLTVTDPVEASMREGGGSDAAVAPMPGALVSLAVEVGDAVEHGQVLAVIESMKMHTEITAPRDGVVERVLVAVGGTFDVGAPLVALQPLDPDPEES